MDNDEKIEKKFDEKKKGKKGLIICILLVIALAAAICTYFMINSKPKNILKKYVNKIEFRETEKLENVKVETKVTAKINTNDKDSQAILDEIAKCTLKFGTQLDVKDKVEIVNLGLDYDNQNVVDAKIVYKNNLYIYLNEIFDKYIEFDVADEETQKNFDYIFNELAKEDLKENSKDIVDITKNFLNDKINSLDNNIESEKTKLTINGKEKSVKKIMVSLSMKEFASYTAEYLEKLAECKAYASDMDIKNMLKTVAESLRTVDFNEKDGIKLNLYTEGLNNNFVCFELEVFIQEENMSVKIQVLKEDKNTYNYTISMSGQGVNIDAVTGTIKIEEEVNNKKQQKGKFTFTAKVAEMLTQGLKINGEICVEYDTQINAGIDNENVDNSIKEADLSEEDINGILEKLQQRPLIGEVINMLMNSTEDAYLNYNF